MTAIDRAYQDVNDLIEHLTSGTTSPTITKYLAERVRAHIARAQEEQRAMAQANADHQRHVELLRGARQREDVPMDAVATHRVHYCPCIAYPDCMCGDARPVITARDSS